MKDRWIYIYFRWFHMLKLCSDHSWSCSSVTAEKPNTKPAKPLHRGRPVAQVPPDRKPLAPQRPRRRP